MKKRDTDEMMSELLKANNIGAYIKENTAYMVKDDLSVFLNTIIAAKGLVKADVIKKTELSEVMGYQIFSGTRAPSRDSLICVCIAMNLTLDETQSLMKIAGFAVLYPKMTRDIIVIKGISENKTVAQINEALYSNGEKTLT